jgi:hypothetical protein
MIRRAVISSQLFAVTVTQIIFEVGNQITPAQVFEPSVATLACPNDLAE